MIPSPSTHYDAIVVGARVAGAPTAMLLARAGARVLLVDRAQRGSDTQSTHALMRGAVLQLRRWGLLDRLIAGGTPPVRATRTTGSPRRSTVPTPISAWVGTAPAPSVRLGTCPTSWAGSAKVAPAAAPRSRRWTTS